MSVHVNPDTGNTEIRCDEGTCTRIYVHPPLAGMPVKPPTVRLIVAYEGWLVSPIASDPGGIDLCRAHRPSGERAA